jgi:hypothetical protein
MALGDASGGLMTVNETYRTDVVTVGPNGAYLYFDNLPGLELDTDPTSVPTAVNITFTVTAHSPVTKIIIGTFSGTAYDWVSGTVKTITNGQFSITYP